MKTWSKFVVASLAAVLVVAGSVVIVTTQPAKALPKYTEQTGKNCSVCHQGAAGGKLTSTGEKFKANGNKF